MSWRTESVNTPLVTISLPYFGWESIRIQTHLQSEYLKTLEMNSYPKAPNVWQRRCSCAFHHLSLVRSLSFGEEFFIVIWGGIIHNHLVRNYQQAIWKIWKIFLHLKIKPPLNSSECDSCTLHNLGFQLHLNLLPRSLALFVLLESHELKKRNSYIKGPKPSVKYVFGVRELFWRNFEGEKTTWLFL